MLRADSLFALCSSILLVVGFGFENFGSTRGISIWRSWHGTGTGIALSVHGVCYGIAALYAVFAFVDALGYLTPNRSISQWHFWLTSLSVALLGFALASLNVPSSLSGEGGQSVTTRLIIYSATISIPLFVLAQLLFLIGLIRAIISIKHAP